MFRKLGLQIQHFDKVISLQFSTIQLRWLTAILVSFIASLLLLSWALPTFATTTASPQTCYVGTYLSSLHDLSPSSKSFNADFWLWSRCPSQQIEELEHNDFLNAVKLDTGFDSKPEKIGNIYYSSRKVSGVFYYDWNLSNFPFDRHVLQIPFENSVFDVNSLVLKPDTSESAYNNNIQLDGWYITGFSIKDSKIRYKTTFGDPSISRSSKSDYSRLTISIAIARNSLTSFFKLNSGAYIAFGISLVTFFLNPTQPTLVSGRIGALVGCLFATLVNLRAIDGVLGRTERLTLSDKIHITIMLYILATIVETVYTRLMNEAGQDKSSRHLDRLSFAVSGISFIVVNLILIASAAIAG